MMIVMYMGQCQLTPVSSKFELYNLHVLSLLNLKQTFTFWCFIDELYIYVMEWMDDLTKSERCRCFLSTFHVYFCINSMVTCISMQ